MHTNTYFVPEADGGQKRGCVPNIIYNKYGFPQVMVESKRNKYMYYVC